MSPRRLAAKQGQRQYTGKPCKACGETLRYTSNAGCVACQIKNSRVSNKLIQVELSSRLNGSHIQGSVKGAK